MRNIVIPDDIQIVEPRTGEKVALKRAPDAEPVLWSVSHEDFLTESVFAHPEILKGGAESLRRVERLQKLFAGCRPGAVIAVDDEDYRLIRGIVERVTWLPHLARFATQFIPHYEAWEKAEKVDA